MATPLPRRAPGSTPLWRDGAAADRAQRDRYVEHFAGLLPLALQRRVVDAGVADSAAALSVAETRAAVERSLTLGAGSNGSAVNGPKACLALLADLCASFEPPVDVLGQIPPWASAALIRREHLRGCLGEGRCLAASALDRLKWLVRHAGLDAPGLDSQLVQSEVRPSVPRPHAGLSTHAVSVRQSGPLPLRALAAIEAFLNAHAEGPGPGCTEPVFVWLGTLVIAVGAGLRIAEARSAALRCDEPRPDVIISGDFTPKCSVADRVNLRRMQFAFDAVGVLGWFAWWPAYRRIMLSYRTLLPATPHGAGVLVAPELTPYVSERSWASAQVLRLMGCTEYTSLTRDLLESRRVRGHSAHVCLDDAVFVLGTDLGINPTVDGLLVGHWSARGSHSAERAAAARNSQQPARYASDAGGGHVRSGMVTAQAAARWRVLSFARAYLLGSDWRGLPVDEASQGGWGPVRAWGLAYVQRGGTVPLPEPWDPWWASQVAAPALVPAPLVLAAPAPLLALPPPAPLPSGAADFSESRLSFPAGPA